MAMPRTERLVAAALAIAAAAIVALAVLVLVELDRESKLNRDVIDQIEVNDELEVLRTNLNALGHAARIAALTGSAESARNVERLSRDAEQRLDEIARHPRRDERVAAFDALSQLTRLLVLNAGSIAQTRAARGAAAAEAAATEAERIASEASVALDHTLDSQAARINRRTLDQLRSGELVRRYVGWSLAGAFALLAALFALYRGAKLRERAALRRIEHLAHFDTVTGLPNRSLLNDRMELETSRARRSERGFALLLFDLDGFKGVNDTWGHAAGDRVLAAVAERARECMRASDTVGRIGGDEFLAILPETTLEGALHVAEKLREALGRPYSVGKLPSPLGASIGVAVYPEHGTDTEALQRAADAALYEAKRGGKNRVRVASSGPSGAKAA
jgi:diguanylate cyclase